MYDTLVTKGRLRTQTCDVYCCYFHFDFHILSLKTNKQELEEKKKKNVCPDIFSQLWMHSNFSFASIDTEYIIHGEKSFCNMGTVLLKFEDQIRVV